MLLAVGCRKKQATASDFNPQFAPTLASGSTGDVMNKFAGKFGVPVYPGASPDTAHFNPGNSDNRTFLTYSTVDSAAKVTQFYTSSLGLQPVSSGNVTELQGTTPAGAQVTINVGRDLQSGRTTFTVLAIMHVTQAPAVPTPAPTAVATTAPVQPAPANTLNNGDSNGQSWNMDTSSMPQNSQNSSDNSQNQVPPDQNYSSGTNGDNGQQSQDQTTGDTGNDQQSQNNGPPGGG